MSALRVRVVSPVTPRSILVLAVTTAVSALVEEMEAEPLSALTVREVVEMEPVEVTSVSACRVTSVAAVSDPVTETLAVSEVSWMLEVSEVTEPEAVRVPVEETSYVVPAELELERVAEPLVTSALT